MDPVGKVKPRKVPLLKDSRVIWAACGGAITVPLFVYFLLMADIKNVNQTWKWRAAVRTDAEITSHDFVSSNFEPTGKVKSQFPAHHILGLRYEADGAEIRRRYQVSGNEPATLVVNGEKFPVEVGGTIPVYYLPSDPKQFVVALDPRASYQASVSRLTTNGIIGASGVVVALIILVCFRPRQAERVMTANLEVPAGQDLRVAAEPRWPTMDEPGTQTSPGPFKGESWK